MHAAFEMKAIGTEKDILDHGSSICTLERLALLHDDTDASDVCTFAFSAFQVAGPLGV